MAPSPRRLARPTPLVSPRRRERLPPRDSDNEARYVVTVRSAKNLKRAGFRGLTNAYCQLNVGRQGPFTTDVIFDSTNPCWEHKRQTFEFRDGNGPEEEKLSLACFNSGDVPELIGRLNVALSHADHKIISLPMFRKDLGGSQIWSGSVEIELHYIPAVDDSPVIAGGQIHGVRNSPSAAGGTVTPAPALSPSSLSPASSFDKKAISYPEKPGLSSGSASEADSVLKALSPGAAKGAEASGDVWSRADNKHCPGSACGFPTSMKRESEKTTTQEVGYGADRRRVKRSFWTAFLSGAVFSVAMMAVSLWVLGGDPVLLVMSGVQSVALGVRVVEETAGRQTFVVLNKSQASRLADRHIVILAGNLEVCRGGVPAPSPPTEGSKWAFDAFTPVSAAAAASCGSSSRRRTGASTVGDCEYIGDGFRGQRMAAAACGRWCMMEKFMRRIAAPLYAAKRERPS